MKQLIIVGAGGFGREIAWLVERINAVKPTWEILGFLDDNEELRDKRIDRYPVLGGIAAATGHKEAYYVCAVGASKVRRAIISKLEKLFTPKYATLIDPSAILSSRVKLQEGCMVCAGSVLTVDIEVGKHSIVNVDSTVGHDAVLEDFVILYPSVNVSGNTRIGACTELGTGVQIIQGKSIGEETIVGAGTVVIKDLPARCTAVGNPARIVKVHESAAE